MDTIQKLKWNVLPHPPYSQDLASSDYHLIGPLKVQLGGKRFRNNEEVIQAVQEWLNCQPKDFFLSGIRKLPDAGASVSQTTEIQEALDKRVHTIGIFIDLTKAYDVLNHKLLLEKLSSYGIRGTTK